MSIRLPVNVLAVLSRQDLASDSVSYEIELDLLGAHLRAPCPLELVQHLDEIISRPQQPQQQQSPQPQAQHKHTRQPQQRQQREDFENYSLGMLEDFEDGEGNV